jgi:hypothetical protein
MSVAQHLNGKLGAEIFKAPFEDLKKFTDLLITTGQLTPKEKIKLLD